LIKHQEQELEQVISAEQIVKIYKVGEIEVPALRGVSISVAPGEFVAIMGASGSGKSTFMNIVGCLDRPTRGRYLLEGRDVSSLNRDRLAEIRNKRIGFVFQNFNLLSRSTALENVELPMLYNGTPIKQREEKASFALQSVGLGGREGQYTNKLSGGEQQRVAIARALVNDPSIILADEPTGNLDSRTSIEVMGILQNLNQKGITIVLVTHEKDIASFTHRNITFKDGKIIKDQKVERPQIAEEVLSNLPPVETEEEIL
jgi:putative ABC transport system ATP-binding protein